LGFLILIGANQDQGSGLMVDFSDWSRKDQGQRQELLRTALDRISDDLERHGRFIEEENE
jgi:hypothetical protein